MKFIRLFSFSVCLLLVSNCGDSPLEPMDLTIGQSNSNNTDDGNDSSNVDCAGVPNGDAVIDSCNICDSDSSNDCTQDCAVTWGGSADNDCFGECGGSAMVDDCGICDGGNSNMDCAGECGGNSYYDSCGYCIDDDQMDCDFDMGDY